MGKKEKLYLKAKTSPTNFTFKNLCELTGLVGFDLKRQTGSHVIYKHPVHGLMINIQRDKRAKSKAKLYQIKELLSYIDDFNLMEDNDV
jgi:predicted RNA binding protein YcfA (HicA-like mRNA interferase family)